MTDDRADILPLPPGEPWIDPHQRGAEPAPIVAWYPSGAKETIIRGPGYVMCHLELPYHEGDIYDLLLNKYRNRSA